MDPKKLYVVRGTGFSLDGSLVEIQEKRGDHYVISPFNTKVDIQDWILVHKKCLEEFSSEKRKYRYTITLEKTDDQLKPNIPDVKVIRIDGYRNVSLDSIVEFITTNLNPILRME